MRCVVVDPILSVQGLEQRYPGGRGVGPVDLELPPGIHGLLGPNGSGKTTFIKTVLGFLRPTGGTGTVLGHDIVDGHMKIRRQVGYMPENDVFVPGLNAVQTVRMGAELCGLSPARAHEAASEALHAVGLGDERFHAPNRLSTGQRQRMKLAGALVHAPRILFLDEPTNGLDPQGRKRMLQLINEVAQEKQISVILSTHILPDVEAVCQDAVVLRDGFVAAFEQTSGRTIEKKGAATWYAVELLGDHDAFLDACKTAGLIVRTERGALQVAARSATAILKVAKQADVVLSRVVPGTRGIEDAVLAHMEGA